jgi:hypothetical protein
MCELIGVAPKASIAARIERTPAGAINTIPRSFQTVAKHGRLLESRDKAGSSRHVVEEDDLRKIAIRCTANRDAQVLQRDLQNLLGAVKERVSKRIAEPEQVAVWTQ